MVLFSFIYYGKYLNIQYKSNSVLLVNVQTMLWDLFQPAIVSSASLLYSAYYNKIFLLDEEYLKLGLCVYGKWFYVSARNIGIIIYLIVKNVGGGYLRLSVNWFEFDRMILRSAIILIQLALENVQIRNWYSRWLITDLFHC